MFAFGLRAKVGDRVGQAHGDVVYYGGELRRGQRLREYVGYVVGWRNVSKYQPAGAHLFNEVMVLYV